MLLGMVQRSARYMLIGSAMRSPILKATVGVVGETSTSTRSNALSKSPWMRERTFCAEP